MSGLIANGRPTVGIVLGDYINSYVEETWEALASVASRLGLNLIAFPDVVRVQEGSLPDFQRMRPFLEPQSIDGLVILAGDFMLGNTDRFLEQFIRFVREQVGVPVVVTGRAMDGIPCAVADQRAGMREGMAHLLDHHGYRRIAFVTGPAVHPHARERLAVYREALAAHGIAGDPSWIYEGDYSFESGIAAAERIVTDGAGRFEAIVCCNDDMLLGVMRVLDREGIQVPQNMRLMGFDDTCEGQAGLGQVTSIRQPVREIAAHVLHGVLDPREMPPLQAFPTRLVIRSSCGCPPFGVMPVEGLSASAGGLEADPTNSWLFDRLDASLLIEPEDKLRFRALIRELPDMLAGGHALDEPVRMMDGILAHLVEGSDLQSAWNDWYISLHNAVAAAAGGTAPERTNELLARLRIQVDRIRHEKRNITRYHSNPSRARRMLGQVRLSQCTSLAELQAELGCVLPSLGIPHYFAALYDRFPIRGAESDPGVHDATVLYASGCGAGADALPGSRFPDCRIVPEGVAFCGERISLMAEVLSFGEDIYGYQIVSLGELGEQLHDTIRPQVCSALHAISAIDRLQDAVDDLNRTRRQLVLAEKMAAMGNLIAGFAHELNTPIGIGVTASSHLQSLIADAEKRLAEGTFGQGELAHLLRIGRESSELLLSTMQRASALVTGFRRLASEGGAERRERFRPAEQLKRVQALMRPILENAQVTVHVACDPAMEMVGYPDAFSRLLTSLLMNAAMHGRPEGGPLQVRITLAQRAGWTEMRLEDDGVGIAPELREKVFEPFYTTARSRGGTGIGLHAVFNTVAQVMQGEIACLESPLGGALFLVRMRSVLQDNGNGPPAET